VTTERGMIDFLSFRWLVTPAVIRVAYVLGTIAFTVWGLRTLKDAVEVAQGLGGDGWAQDTLLWGLAILVLGNLLWRILCELLVVFFNIEEHLAAVREDLPYTLCAVERPLEGLSRRFEEGARELTAIKEELREGVSFTDLRETLAALTEKIEQGTARFAAVGEALQEELSRGGLRDVLSTVAQRLEEGAGRLAHLEENLSAIAWSPCSESPARIPGLEEANHQREEASVPGGSPARLGRRVLKRALVVIGLVVLVGTGLFVSLPLVADSTELPSLDPQALRDFFADAWSYWMSLIQGKGS